jgi:cob(I)alamin adenosyltransferase
MKIYTKQGDDGSTLIPAVGRISKDSSYVNAVGDIEELNAWVGAIYNKYPFVENLQEIQIKLLDAINQVSNSKQHRELVKKVDVSFLETMMDKLDTQIPPLKASILPGFPSEAYIARSVCRRAERSVNAVQRIHEGSSRYLVPYLNRLGDTLLVVARYVDHRIKEVQKTIGKKSECRGGNNDE